MKWLGLTLGAAALYLGAGVVVELHRGGLTLSGVLRWPLTLGSAAAGGAPPAGGGGGGPAPPPPARRRPPPGRPAALRASRRRNRRGPRAR